MMGAFWVHIYPVCVYYTRDKFVYSLAVHVPMIPLVDCGSGFLFYFISIPLSLFPFEISQQPVNSFLSLKECDCPQVIKGLPSTRQQVRREKKNALSHFSLALWCLLLREKCDIQKDAEFSVSALACLFMFFTLSSFLYIAFCMYNEFIMNQNWWFIFNFMSST